MKSVLTLLVLVVAVRVGAQNQTARPPDTTLVGVRPISPKFPGGHEALLKYIAEHLQVPDTSFSGGKVWVEFMVETDGSLTEVSVKKGLSALADVEALRLVRGMPRWIPGRWFDGEPMRQQIRLPVYICVR